VTTAAIASNKAAVLAFFEAFNRGDIDSAVSYWADDARNYGMRDGEMQTGRASLHAVLNDIRTTFPDYRHEVEEIVAENDIVVCRATESGTHSGRNTLAHHRMPPGTEPTGKSFRSPIIHMYRFLEGGIVEHWAGRDDLGVHLQLGLRTMVAETQP
jgi:predicted ester cyclase